MKSTQHVVKVHTDRDAKTGSVEVGFSMSWKEGDATAPAKALELTGRVLAVLLPEGAERERFLKRLQRELRKSLAKSTEGTR